MEGIMFFSHRHVPYSPKHFFSVKICLNPKLPLEQRWLHECISLFPQYLITIIFTEMMLRQHLKMNKNNQCAVCSVFSREISSRRQQPLKYLTELRTRSCTLCQVAPCWQRLPPPEREIVLLQPGSRSTRKWTGGRAGRALLPAACS